MTTEQSAKNNSNTDWFIIAQRMTTGPFTQCQTCRYLNRIIDCGDDGCKAIIHFCAQDRQLNKHIYYKMRPKPKEDKDEVKKNEEPIEVKEDINEPN
jgi:hypothetical protein